MAWTEDTSKRARNVKQFVDGNLRRAVISVHDQHYHDGTNWQDCDESFAAETGTFAHQCTAVRHAIHIGATGTRRWMPRRDHPTEYIEFGRLQSWSGSAWANVNLGTPTRTGKKISWSTTNFDLSLTNNWHRVKIEAVLKTEAARRRLRWAVTLNGLTYDNGDLTALSDSVIVGHVDKPVAWDANGSYQNQNVTIATTYSGGYIEFGGDLSAAVLPITIDPTLTLQPDATDGLDNFLWEDASTTNSGTSASIQMTSTAGYRKRMLIKFDLSSLSGVTVTSGSLSIYLSDAKSGDMGATYQVGRILSANSTWTEAGSTWDHSVGTTHWAGDTGSDGGSDAGCSVSGTDFDSTLLGTYTFTDWTDLVAGTELATSLTTAQVTSMIANNYGLVLQKFGGWQDPYFASSDHATAGYRPKLVVDYTEGGTSTSMTLGGASTPTGTITKSIGSTKAGAITPSGVLTRTISILRTLAGASTPSGTVSKSIGSTKAGAITPSGVLASIKARVSTFAGELTSGGVLTRTISILRTLAGASTPSGTITKSIATTKAGAITPSGVLTYLKAMVATFAGAVTSAGTLAKSIGRTLAGAITPSGVLTRTISILRTLAGAIASAGELISSLVGGGTSTPMTLSGAITPSGTLAKSIGRTLAGAVGITGTITKAIGKAFAGALTFIGVLNTGGPLNADPDNCVQAGWRDRRVGVAWRDKRSAVEWRDRRTEAE